MSFDPRHNVPLGAVVFPHPTISGQAIVREGLTLYDAYFMVALHGLLAKADTSILLNNLVAAAFDLAEQSLAERFRRAAEGMSKATRENSDERGA